jgi:hypothetical protein
LTVPHGADTMTEKVFAVAESRLTGPVDLTGNATGGTPIVVAGDLVVGPICVALICVALIGVALIGVCSGPTSWAVPCPAG